MKNPTRSALVLIISSVACVSISFYLYQVAFTPNILVDKPDRFVYIYENDTYKDVYERFKKDSIINDNLSFAFVSKLLGIQKKVKPGRYLLTSNMSNKDAVMLIRSGRQTPVKLTFNSVRLKSQLNQRICAQFMADTAEFDSLLKDPAYTSKMGFDTSTIVCMFIPNTYEIYWNTNAKDLLDRLKKEYNSFWTEERLTKAQKLHMSPIEVSILASIIHEETYRKDELPRIAGVYYNRLFNTKETDHKLQADPTIKFALKDFALKRVSNLSVDSPYNTYRYPGLPPGPICVPSIPAIDAVLNKEDHSYVYFAAKGDGSGYHNFTTTFNEHVKNKHAYLNKVFK